MVTGRLSLLRTVGKYHVKMLSRRKVQGQQYCSGCIHSYISAVFSVDVEEGAPSMGAKALCIPEDPKYARKVLDGAKCFRPGCTNKAEHNTLFGRSY